MDQLIYSLVISRIKVYDSSFQYNGYNLKIKILFGSKQYIDFSVIKFTYIVKFTIEDFE
jgi:hypothetical protein